MSTPDEIAQAGKLAFEALKQIAFHPTADYRARVMACRTLLRLAKFGALTSAISPPIVQNAVPTLDTETDK